MPNSDSRPEVLVDTSAAVALVVVDHEHHGTTLDAMGSRRVGLAGHAAFETYSVLTRLPSPLRRSPGVVAALLADNFPASCHLSEAAADALLQELGPEGIAGGSVYDALVGAAARQHGIVLATRDRRALVAYRALKIEVELLL